ncbi:MAG: SDR family oxidoreductase [Gemmataceae bacterium]|nr:SDR family oxidoreductase [Gemmataceae bacterium]
MKLLILGCGYLGERVARGWSGPVAALTRSADHAARIRSAGWEPVAGDVCDPALSLPPADVVVWAVGLDRTAGRTMRDVYVEGLANAARQVDPATRFVLVSSTGVYGQSAGEDVDEFAATEPRDESGRVVLEAERTLRAMIPDAVILRFAGIYGPGRLLRKMEQLQAREPIIGDANAWLNLIHVNDGAAVVRAASQNARPGTVYNVSDGAPIRRRDYFSRLAELAGMPAPVFNGQPGPRPANRRIVSRRVWAELELIPRYPNAFIGLEDCVTPTRAG